MGCVDGHMAAVRAASWWLEHGSVGQATAASFAQHILWTPPRVHWGTITCFASGRMHFLIVLVIRGASIGIVGVVRNWVRRWAHGSGSSFLLVVGAWRCWASHRGIVRATHTVDAIPSALGNDHMLCQRTHALSRNSRRINRHCCCGTQRGA